MIPLASLKCGEKLMRKAWVCAFAVAAALWIPAGIRAQGKSGGALGAASADAPGCEGKNARQCVELALDAMGGRERLQQIKSTRLQNISHTLLLEQSYRQAPFITSYERDSTVVDFANQRLRTDAKVTWPEADANQADFDQILIVGPEGGVNHAKESDSPCGLSD